jgi:hypothetical protein
MACLPLYSRTETRFSRVPFGRNYSVSRAPLWHLAQHTTLSRMVKQRPLTNALKLTFDAMRVQSRGNGVCGFLWLSGGTTRTTTHLLDLLLSRPFTVTHHRLCYPIFRGPLLTSPSIPSYRTALLLCRFSRNICTRPRTA